MDKIAKDAATRTELFKETAERRGLSATIIEKDFWVCWVLGKIFAHPEIGAQLIFKGGTSLSKVFGVIDRFSEDIDLSFRRDALGFQDEAEPERGSNNTQKRKRLEDLRAACTNATHNRLLPILHKIIASVLSESSAWRLEIDPANQDTILFTYPQAMSAYADAAYIRPAVKLEMGVGSDPFPIGRHSIISYAAEEFPDLFAGDICEVIALEAERTFWEKATLLHAEYHRSPDSTTPLRLSRHYSDLARLTQTPTKIIALHDTALRLRVVEHKSFFFRSGWAHYDLAIPGSFHILPHPDREEHVKSDYANMREMFFQDPPAWKNVRNVLRELEDEINQLPQ